MKTQLKPFRNESDVFSGERQMEERANEAVRNFYKRERAEMSCWYEAERRVNWMLITVTSGIGVGIALSVILWAHDNLPGILRWLGIQP